MRLTFYTLVQEALRYAARFTSELHRSVAEMRDKAYIRRWAEERAQKAMQDE